ncbi:hypothetical protein IGI04_041456 [Brassica rapa subsp. trilocularis]|uniref:Uncharacterized protein n=1 Tax=Brassica rapa subsp. trilocularis TaxID=1813537 RepID=A0ABQ7KQW1_BRACM|nr:hypothetical protein IGI04_041456 [Brassica rapa subsp. trilocularis]
MANDLVFLSDLQTGRSSSSVEVACSDFGRPGTSGVVKSLWESTLLSDLAPGLGSPSCAVNMLSWLAEKVGGGDDDGSFLNRRRSSWAPSARCSCFQYFCSALTLLLLHPQPHDAAQLSHVVIARLRNGGRVMVTAESEWQGAGVVTAWQ